MGVPTVRPPIARDPNSIFERETREAIKALDQVGVRKVTVLNVLLTTATTLVPHQLGKKPIGWIIINKNAQADVWCDTTQTTTADRIPLRASATVTVDIQFW
jgi:hypothetical protein